MINESLSKLSAPAERSSLDEFQAQHEKLSGQSLVRTLIDCFPEPAMILNKHHQIVLANDKLACLLARPRDSLIGMRWGEAVGCLHATERTTGCGTTDFCLYCGAFNAIVNSQHAAQPQAEECRIQRALDERTVALDLRVWATPLVVGDELFTVFAIRDTTDEKRRKVLERLFFHDILNTASGLSGLLEILPDLAQEEAAETSQEARFLAEQLIEEIQSQRDLEAAERGDLLVTPVVIDAAETLDQISRLYRHHSVAEGKTLVVRECLKQVVLQSDAGLIARVLGNLIKNALEASKKGQTVTVWVQEGAMPSFVIHNESVMSDAVRHQMFQRSFTTKSGAGHGIGTYSVKLLTENYLNGTVEFHSTEPDGTTFIVRLPAQLGPPKQGALRGAQILAGD